MASKGLKGAFLLSKRTTSTISKSINGGDPSVETDGARVRFHSEHILFCSYILRSVSTDSDRREGLDSRHFARTLMLQDRALRIECLYGQMNHFQNPRVNLLPSTLVNNNLFHYLLFAHYSLSISLGVKARIPEVVKALAVIQILRHFCFSIKGWEQSTQPSSLSFKEVFSAKTGFARQEPSNSNPPSPIQLYTSQLHPYSFYLFFPFERSCRPMKEMVQMGGILPLIPTNRNAIER